MDAFLRLLLTNAALSGLLALAAWAASRVVRRQAVVHGLWLLALVKLLTPPLVGLPLLPAGEGPATGPERRAAARETQAGDPAAPATRERAPSRPEHPADAGASPRAGTSVAPAHRAPAASSPRRIASSLWPA